MAYIINFKKHTIKELDKINEPFYSLIKQAIYNLADNLRPSGCKKLKGREGYHIRVGNYRIIYDIYNSELVVSFIALGHRKDIYD
ncbi:MAG: type II toxin-antitoxin system RelE/ParE family toxin [Paludibacter sp.]|nr:type II toxin-antitoxin system RelE/ParE family toxin [Paludibacter sp.]